MIEDHSQIEVWLDESFFKLGAYLTLENEDKVILAKGGVVSETNTFSDDESFYLKDFFQDKYLALRPEHILLTTKSAILKVIKSWDRVSFESTHVTEDDTYAEDFADLKKCFNQDLKKVVLVSRDSLSLAPSIERIRSLFARSFEFGAGLPYGFWFHSYGVIGSTPEVLFKITDSKLSTFALASTARKGEEETLLKSPKDRQEHNLVIQDITEKLATFCSHLKVDETKLFPYKNIVHLKTDITATPREDMNLKSLTDSMSPTAALGGYPKMNSLKFLRATRYAHKHPTRFFGSAMGVSSKKFSQFIVMIRNVQWTTDHFYIESGGGVLPESELDNELREIRLKRQTVQEHYLT